MQWNLWWIINICLHSKGINSPHLGRCGFLTAPMQGVNIILKSTIKKMLVAVIILGTLWIPTTQAQETEPSDRDSQAYTQTLRWKGGDVLPGQLLESKPGTVRWSSPYFTDDLVVDIDVLDSVVFPERSVPATEAFRVGTVSGDVWMADIVDSDDQTFLFSSKRHGQFRVSREAIYILERQMHPNLIFDGSRLTDWELPERDVNDRLQQFRKNTQSSWYADREGHPRTDKIKAKIFHPLDLPQRFEIDLELASTVRPPGFVFALGKNIYDTLRLETWVNELVVVQGTLFESVSTIQPDQRSFRLRLVYDGDAEVLEVFDFAGDLLLKLDGVKQTVEEPGLYVYNRGQNLTVRRLRVYRNPVGFAEQQVDFSKPRIHMMDGQVVYGKLFVEKEDIYVLDADGTRRNVDLQEIDRVVQPGTALVDMEHLVAITYPDGAILQGEIVGVNPDGVVLQTTFADEPVTCGIAGASLLRIEPNGSGTRREIKGRDKLFHPSGTLHGRVLLDGQDETLIRWKPIGALEAVRLASTWATRIERNSRRASKTWPYSTAQSRHVLHLRNGENIPCQISAYDGSTVSFQSPFISGERVDSAYVKALEFSGRTHTKDDDKRQRNATRTGRGEGPFFALEGGEFKFNDPNIQKIEIITRHEEVGPGAKNEPKVRKVTIHRGNGEGAEIIIDGENIEELEPGDMLMLKNLPGVGEWIVEPSQQEPKSDGLSVKLTRALTVPRFNRDNPPSHILVAENGDMKRGKLIGLDGEAIQFDSKLRQFSMPVDRVVRVVEVSVDGGQRSAISSQKNNHRSESGSQESLAIRSEVGIKLTDGSILIFEPLEVKDGELLGKSSIYGAVAVPVDSIEHFYFGNTSESFKTAFEAWVVRPAKEPTFSDNPQ